MAKIAGYLGSSLQRFGRQLVLSVGGSVGVVSTTISADATFDESSAMVSLINGGAANRNITALASCEIAGMVKVFKNTGSTNNHVLKDSSGTAITGATLAPGDWGVIAHNGTAWVAMVSTSAATILATAATWTGLQTFSAGAALKDSVSYFYDDGDATKKLAFQCSGITTGTTRTLTAPDASGTIALTSSNITGSAGSVASTGYFLSAQQTGNGLAQDIAHGLGVTPNLVFAIPDDIGGGGVFAVSYGTHTSTNAVVTFSNGQKYRVVAFK